MENLRRFLGGQANGRPLVSRRARHHQAYLLVALGDNALPDVRRFNVLLGRIYHDPQSIFIVRFSVHITDHPPPSIPTLVFSPVRCYVLAKQYQVIRYYGIFILNSSIWMHNIVYMEMSCQ